MAGPPRVPREPRAILGVVFENLHLQVYAQIQLLKNGSWGILDPRLKKILEQNYRANGGEVQINMDRDQSDVFLYKGTDFPCKREVVDILYLDFIKICDSVT